MKSSYKQSLEQTLYSMLSGEALETGRFITTDEEINHWQELANAVSIRRLGFNDHGPVHMRKVAINAMKMFNILKEEGIQPSIVKEDTGSYEDSRIAVLLTSFLHDIGMSVGRQNHEISSFVLAERIIDRVLYRSSKATFTSNNYKERCDGRYYWAHDPSRYFLIGSRNYTSC